LEPAAGLVAGGPRPRRLALLAILAARGTRGISRERVLAILWPDSSEERGRHALSQTLYALRNDLGVEAVSAGPSLALDPAIISTDLDDFRAAIEARDWPRAAALYEGPFADGFTLADAPGFEEWVETERNRIARDGIAAMESAAHDAESTGDFRVALAFRRRLVTLEPLSTRHAIGYVQALLGVGDRTGAIEHARAHNEFTRRELDADPDPSLAALVNGIRHTPVRDDAPRTPEPVLPLSTPPGSGRSRKAGVLAGLALLIVFLGGAAWYSATARRDEPLPVLAVGQIRDLATPDTVRLGGVLGDMLSTNLARVSRLEIIAPTRLMQALPPEPDPGGRALTAAARQAGATEILEGEVTTHPTGFRLDLRRVDIRRGRLREGYTVIAADRFALIDSATAAVTRDLELRGPSSSVVEVTTRSPIAYRLYEEGLRAYFQVDAYAAARLFRAALAEDSTFALAAFYAWKASLPERDSLGRIARRLASRAPDRERWLLLTQMAATYSDRLALATADSLLARFPSDPDALIAANNARQHLHGYRPEIVAGFERAFLLDSMTGPGALGGARVADAFDGMVAGYMLADSLAAAERTLRRWAAVQPEHASPHYHLAHVLEFTGRIRDADIEYARTDELSLTSANIVHIGVWKGLNRGDPDLIRQSCEFGLSSARDSAQYSDYRWHCMLAYRTLGRLRDALELTGSRRLLPQRGNGSGAFVPAENLNRLIIDFSMGRPLVAARGFLDAAKLHRGKSAWAGEDARYQTWWMTLAATAFVEQDTAAAAALVDSVRYYGSQSLYGRDPLLHHFVRGRLLARANRHEEALAELERATYSWTLGYTRVNLEYARCALGLGRPRDAIRVLQAALHGQFQGPQLYVTRTELHELLAQAFDAASMPDSARTHFRYVARMWAGADPEFQTRHRLATAWLARNGGA
jgi:DNA-binding SARP family transcriptional activator